MDLGIVTARLLVQPSLQYLQIPLKVDMLRCIPRMNMNTFTLAHMAILNMLAEMTLKRE